MQELKKEKSKQNTAKRKAEAERASEFAREIVEGFEAFSDPKEHDSGLSRAWQILMPRLAKHFCRVSNFSIDCINIQSSMAVTFRRRGILPKAAFKVAAWGIAVLFLYSCYLHCVVHES